LQLPAIRYFETTQSSEALHPRPKTQVSVQPAKATLPQASRTKAQFRTQTPANAKLTTQTHFATAEFFTKANSAKAE
jgi:hypothetical protein